MTFEVTPHGGIDPKQESPRLVAQHRSAYEFALNFTRGARVLEIGFGRGYGTHFLAQTAAHATGIDLFEDNVQKARREYQRPNLEFAVMDATELAFEAGTFDVVCSFQVIEHIPERLLPRYIDEIKRVLKKGGRAIITTPNLKKNQKPGQPYDKSPHHDKEFTPREFRDFLGPCFPHLDIYGLYPRPHLWAVERLKKAGVLNFLPPSLNPVHCTYAALTTSDFEWKKRRDLDGCIDLLACAIS